MEVKGNYIVDMNGTHFWVHDTNSFFGRICHQRPERSFFVNGSQLPICARCIGLYLGVLFGIFFSLMFKRIIFSNIILILSLSVLLILVEIGDFYIRKEHLIKDYNSSRFIIGILGGIGLGGIVTLLFFMSIRFINPLLFVLK